MKKERNSNIEILRIIAMFMIVLHHYCVHGMIDSQMLEFSFNKNILQVFELGNLGVIIFIMITGFFLYNQKFNFKRILKILLSTWVYSLVIFVLIVLIIGLKSPNKEMILYTFFPLTFGGYWFITAYVLLLLISPFLNKMIMEINRKKFLMIIGLFLILWSIIPTFTNNNFYGNEICQFILFYIIGAYIGKYRNNTFSTKKNAIILIITSSMLLIASTLLLNYLAQFNSKIYYGTYFYCRNSILTIALSIGLISLFAGMKPRVNKYINKISACTFGVYLIHDSNILRSIIWNDLFNNGQYTESWYLLLHLLGSAIIIFVSCTIIEYIRQKIMGEKLCNLLYQKLCSLIEILKVKTNKYFKNIE